MNILAIILIVLAIALFIWWGVVPTLSFLLWVAIILAVIAVIVFHTRSVRSVGPARKLASPSYGV